MAGRKGRFIVVMPRHLTVAKEPARLTARGQPGIGAPEEYGHQQRAESPIIAKNRRLTRTTHPTTIRLARLERPSFDCKHLGNTAAPVVGTSVDRSDLLERRMNAAASWGQGVLILHTKNGP